MLRWQTFSIYYLPRYTRLEQNNTQISDVEQFLAKYSLILAIEGKLFKVLSVALAKHSTKYQPLFLSVASTVKEQLLSVSARMIFVFRASAALHCPKKWSHHFVSCCLLRRHTVRYYSVICASDKRGILCHYREYKYLYIADKHRVTGSQCYFYQLLPPGSALTLTISN